MRRSLLLIAILLVGTPGSIAAQVIGQTAPASDGVSQVLRQIERALEANDIPAYAALVANGISPVTSAEFIGEWIVPGITRAVVQERLRAPSRGVPEGDGFDLYVDALTEFGRTGRVGTWLIELRRQPEKGPDTWGISALTVLTMVRGLYRLELNPDKEFAVENLTITAEDFQARLPQGVAFVAEAEGGITGIVLLGKGELTFSPAPEAEKGQVKIFSGEEILRTRFESLFIRSNTAEFASYVSPSALRPRAVDLRDLRRANLVFEEKVELSFSLDLSDLSRDSWSVIPKAGDVVTEIDADKAQLAYMRLGSDPEDIRLFDRTRNRTISIYPSKAKLAARGPFFDEDDQVDYDILTYDIDASFDPEREWIDAKARLVIVPKRGAISTLTLSLAEPLVIRSVTSNWYGYLMALRVNGQNDVIINLPTPLKPDTVLALDFVYGGRLPAVPPDREALNLAQQQDEAELFTVQPEPYYLYTGRSYWYPQGQLTDYATANLTLRVPENFSSVASGGLTEGFPRLVLEGQRAWKEYQFSATQPSRYLAWLTSKFVHAASATVSVPIPEEGSPLVGVTYYQSELSVESSSIFRRRARELAVDTQDAMTFYGTLVGDIPYQSFTLAVVERGMPGGHSPPYFAALNQPPPSTPILWRADPVYFVDFPEFFVAHEVAHQWWGQAVGWKNYHEQWLSEGLAHYFAMLFAEHTHRKESFDRIVSQMTRWTMNRSNQGPVYLGYRLGHIKSDSRVFRALVYNKGALTLHMLRRLIGDEAFFNGVRRFYVAWRFKKAGTNDLQAAFEAEAYRPLGRFFERWIYGSALPRLKFSYRTEADAVVVRFEQVGEVFDVPVTVSLQYTNASSWAETIVPVTEQVTEQRIPLSGVLKDVEANRDNAAPVIFVK